MFLHFVFSLAITTSFLIANQVPSEPCQLTDVPLGVVNLNVGPSPEFSVRDFKPVLEKQPLTVRSIAVDVGPRRILLVLDRFKKLSPDTRQAEQSIVKTLLSFARPDDQFALITVRGPQQFVPFTKDRDEILRAVATEDKSAPMAAGVLATLLKNIEVFGSPQPGDAIVAIAAGLGHNRSSRSHQFTSALLQRHIRFFGIALGPVARYSLNPLNRTYTIFQSSGPNSSLIAMMTPLSETGDHDFQPLTVATGGFVLEAMNRNPYKPEKFKDPQVVSRINTQTKSIFALVAKYYRLEIEAPKPGRWYLGLSDDTRKTAPGVLLLYPHELWPTSAGCGMTNSSKQSEAN